VESLVDVVVYAVVEMMKKVVVLGCFCEEERDNVGEGIMKMELELETVEEVIVLGWWWWQPRDADQGGRHDMGAVVAFMKKKRKR